MQLNIQSKLIYVTIIVVTLAIVSLIALLHGFTWYAWVTMLMAIVVLLLN